MTKLTVVMAALCLALPCAFGAPDSTGALVAACKAPAQKLDEAGFVRIGGIEQWITIKGDNCANPVILMLHGGPGNTNSPFADAAYGSWYQHYTVVQWDQRGAGMTYGKSKPGPGDMLTIEQMRDDGIAVTNYLRAHLGASKVILMGGSWSSILGVHMAKARPELFHAYIGSAHMVNFRINQAATYNQTLALARAAGDAETVGKLTALGEPPWTNPRHFGVLRRAVRKYEAMTSVPAPREWSVPTALYATPQAQADYDAGEDYSFIQAVGLKGDGMFSKVDLPALGLDFGLPVFFVEGEQDLLTTPALARAYFDSIKAPLKEFVLVPKAGHDPNPPYLEAQWKVLNERVRPLVK